MKLEGVGFVLCCSIIVFADAKVLCERIIITMDDLKLSPFQTAGPPSVRLKMD